MKLTLDFETFYSTTYSLTKMTTMEYVRNPQFKIHGVGIKIDNDPIEYIREYDVEEALNDIWEPEVELICHNSKFDAYILASKFKLFAAMYYDTMSMSAGLFPSQGKGLNDLSLRLLNKFKGTELIKTKGLDELPEDVALALENYCKKDVSLTYECFQKMIKRYPQSELDLIDLHIRMFINPKFKINQVLVSSFLKKALEKQKKLVEASGYKTTQLASNPQFVEILKEHSIEAPTKISLTTGKETYALAKNDLVFKDLQKKHPDLKHIWQARLTVKSTIDRTRAKRMLSATDPETGLLPVALNYYGAHTGRFSGSEKLNFQNLRRGSDLRKALTAPAGNKVVVVDSSNIEARVLAWLANERLLLKWLEDGEDVYANFASNIYPELAPVTKAKHPIERFVGKVAVLGLGYGMGWKRFQDQLLIGEEPVYIDDAKAQAIVYDYRKHHPLIKNLWRTASLHLYNMRVENTDVEWGPMIVRYKEIVLPNGLALKYPNLRSIDNTEYYNTALPDGVSDEQIIESKKTIKTYGAKIVENVIQALSRIIVMDQMMEISKRYDVVLTVHDEVVSIVPDTEAEEAYKFMLNTMKTSPSWAKNLPLDAEGGYDVCYSK